MENKKIVRKIFIVSIFLFLTIITHNALAATDCTNDSSVCDGGQVCADAGYGIRTCVNPRAVGSPCSADYECQTKNCEDAGYGAKACAAANNSNNNTNSGDLCSSTKPGFICLDTAKVIGETECVSNLCPGTPAAVKCCKAPTGTSSTTGTSGTSTGSASTSSTEFSNPLRFSSVDQFLSQILGALQKIIVTLSLLMIVYGAVLYVTSAGGKQIDTAKNAITSALVGLAIGIAAPSFLKEIAGILGWGTSDTRLANALSLTQIATNVLNFLLGILGILSLIMLVYGAGMYLTSAGDSSQVDTGKKIFRYALIGVTLAMASMVLVTQVAKLFVAA